jgi:hypothetical protein
MATNYSGFAEGFQGGFGLMTDAFDRARLRDIQEQERQDMAKYRLDQTQLERERNEETKRAAQADEAYRTQQLEFDAADRARDDALASRTRDIQEQQATTAGITAQAAADAAEAARQDEIRERTIQEHAVLTNELLSLADLPSEQRNLPQNVARIDEILDVLKGSQFYDPSKALRANMEEYNTEITAVLTKLQSGEDIGPGDITPGVRAAITEGLSVNNARFVGSTITPEDFPQAPASAAGGTILDVHVHDVSFASGTPGTAQAPAVAGQLRAKVAVKYRTKDGEIGYYYPDLTNNRSSTQGTPFTATLSETAQAYAGRATMMSELKANPRFKELVDERLMDRDHGGKDKFNSTVDEVTKTIITELKKLEGGVVGDDFDVTMGKDYGPKYGGIVQVGEDARDLENNVQGIRERVRERLLYGRPVRTEIERSDAYISDIKEGLRTKVQPIGTGERQKKLNSRGREIYSTEASQNLEAFLGVSLDSLTSQQLVILNDFFESDGSLTLENEKKLERFRDTQIVREK